MNTRRYGTLEFDGALNLDATERERLKKILVSGRQSGKTFWNRFLAFKKQAIMENRLRLIDGRKKGKN